MQIFIAVLILLYVITIVGTWVCISEAMGIMKQFKNDKNDKRTKQGKRVYGCLRSRS